MADDLVLLGLELERELRLGNHELNLKRNLLNEERKTLQQTTTELQGVRSELIKSQSELQELKAQLQVRFKGMQRLEEENTALRDAVAKLKVQTESYEKEREAIMGRCHTAEMDLHKSNEEVTILRNELDGNTAFKERCLFLQNQTRSTIEQILSKEAQLEKEQIRLDRCCQEGIAFTQEVHTYAKLQAEFVKQSNAQRTELETYIFKLVAALEEAHTAKKRFETEKQPENTLKNEWLEYQKMMTSRVEGLMDENQKLQEELTLVRAQKDVTQGNCDVTQGNCDVTQAAPYTEITGSIDT